MTPNLLIWGAKSQARIAILLLEEMGVSRNDMVIFDEKVSYLSLDNVQVINKAALLRKIFPNLSSFVVAIGGEHGLARTKIGNNLTSLGLNAINLISSHSNVHHTATMGRGLQIMQGAQIAPYSVIGDFTIINTNSTLDHESKIGAGVHLMGSSAIAGRVSIDEYSTIGTNATILPNLNICSDVFVGAGAVVTKSIIHPGVYKGVPAHRYADFFQTIDWFDFKVLSANL